jgi:hypothetical protein
VKAGHDPPVFITRLAAIVCHDNFTEMHAFKHHQWIVEEYNPTREPWRWQPPRVMPFGNWNLLSSQRRPPLAPVIPSPLFTQIYVRVIAFGHSIPVCRHPISGRCFRQLREAVHFRNYDSAID